MRNKTEIAIASALVVLLIFSFAFATASASFPSSVASVGATASNAIIHSFQRKAFPAKGLLWFFYSDGTNLLFKTSTDAALWGSATTIRSCSSGEYFSVWFDGEFMHYVVAPSSANTPIYYRRGTPNSNGSITFTNEQIAVPAYSSVTYSIPFLSVDSNGYAWIGFRQYNSTSGSYGIYVTRSGNNDGTWGTTPNGFPYLISPTIGTCIPIPLTNGKMVVFYHNASYGVEYALPYDGSNWGSNIANTGSAVYNDYLFSVVANADTVHTVYMDTSFNVKYARYFYYNNSFGTETILHPTDGSHQAFPVITKHPITNDLYVFYCPETNIIYLRKYNASQGVWSPEKVFVNETLSIEFNKITSFYSADNDNVGVFYMAGTGSPYYLKFAFLPKLNMKTVDSNGNALVNATVAISDGITTQTKTTDANGWANWTLLESDNYQINVSFQDVLVNETIAVTMDAYKTLNVTCNVYSLTVNVVNIGNQPVSNIPLLLYRNDTLINGMYGLPDDPETNTSGMFTWSQLAYQPASYTIIIPGATSQTVPLTNDTTITLTMPPPSRPPAPEPTPTPTPLQSLIELIIAWCDEHKTTIILVALVIALILLVRKNK